MCSLEKGIHKGYAKRPGRIASVTAGGRGAGIWRSLFHMEQTEAVWKLLSSRELEGQATCYFSTHVT
jgi:cation transport regulator ChaC